MGWAFELRCNQDMKQLPDILTSATFWASIGTLWAAAGAWFTYVAASLDSRRKTYDGVSNLVEGLEAELALVSEWAAGTKEDEKGYLKATRGELIKARPDWFNPSRMIFTFGAPTLSGLTSSPYAKSMGPVINPMVRLSHSIRRFFDYIDRYQSFVMGDVDTFQSVLAKLAPKSSPLEVAHSMPPEKIVTPYPWQVKWEKKEHTYINHVFMMNETIHQGLIGGADSTDELCLYKSFRTARSALEKFKGGLRQESLPRWYWALHFIAACLAIDGLWQVLRWYGLWPQGWRWLP